MKARHVWWWAGGVVAMAAASWGLFGGERSPPSSRPHPGPVHSQSPETPPRPSAGTVSTQRAASQVSPLETPAPDPALAGPDPAPDAQAFAEIEKAVGSGDIRAARQQARDFFAVYPDSPWAERVTRLTGVHHIPRGRR